MNNLETIKIKVKDFDLGQTLNCGQCFRYIENADNSYTTIAFNKLLTLKQVDDTLFFHNTTKEEVEDIWFEYFDLNTDYGKIKKIISSDPTLKVACDKYYGIHILKQDSWEAICSFIISQNNNIPRIKGIISRLCENFGEEIPSNKLDSNNDIKYYSFPTSKKIASLNLEDLDILKAGFRNKYLLDAAQKIDSGEVSVEEIKFMQLEEAKKTLMQIKGIGPKVADCALLFGFYRIDAFPIDVWIKRVLDKYYKDGFPKEFDSIAGMAQQYLFMYERENTKE